MNKRVLKIARNRTTIHDVSAVVKDGDDTYENPPNAGIFVGTQVEILRDTGMRLLVRGPSIMAEGQPLVTVWAWRDNLDIQADYVKKDLREEIRNAVKMVFDMGATHVLLTDQVCEQGDVYVIEPVLAPTKVSDVIKARNATKTTVYEVYSKRLDVSYQALESRAWHLD
jgi:hypothetical protein